MRLHLPTLLLPLLAACPDREMSAVIPSQDKVETVTYPVSTERDLDLLFVIDNSVSMAEEQAALAANFPQFINVLANLDGGLPNVHIGVVSSDMGGLGALGPGSGCDGRGDDGVLQARAACGISGLYLSDVDDGAGGRTVNYAGGSLASAFSCAATIGDQGCGFEQHLESMRRALTPGHAANAGFLRDDAYLAVVFVADEDDCSARDPALFGPDSASLGPLESFRCFEFGVECDPVADVRAVGPRTSCTPRQDSDYLHDVSGYVDFLLGLKRRPEDIVVAGILSNAEPVVVGRKVRQAQGDMVPDLVPSCTYVGPDGPQGARPAIRLHWFLEQFANRNTVTTICDDDLSDALVEIGELVREVIGDPCIEGNLADVDPVTAGVQASCAVSDVTDRGTETEREDPVPACNADASNLPCWRLKPDAMQCARYPTQLAMDVVRASPAPDDTDVVARCVTQ
ncbi:MAG: VWA domain-containing protein [Kofleriaceae bacterium]|nr:VWA domain-containing protein [Kofleriaceae bacterium]